MSLVRMPVLFATFSCDCLMRFTSVRITEIAESVTRTVEEILVGDKTLKVNFNF